MLPAVETPASNQETEPVYLAEDGTSVAYAFIQLATEAEYDNSSVSTVYETAQATNTTFANDEALRILQMEEELPVFEDDSLGLEEFIRENKKEEQADEFILTDEVFTLIGEEEL